MMKTDAAKVMMSAAGMRAWMVFGAVTLALLHLY